MGRPAKLNQRLRAAIKDDLRAGMTQTAIATKYGVHKSTVGRVDREGIDGTTDIDREDNTTEEELEAMIAERLPTMPREPKQSGGPRLPLAVARGRGMQSRPRRIEA